jgi:SAM-dependent methyltransferase
MSTTPELDAIPFSPRQFSWFVSSILYRFSYIQIANQVDDDLFAYLGNRLQGALVADCGCGPGRMVEKLLSQGVERVFAIDSNAGMLQQLRDRLPEAIQTGAVIPVYARFDEHIFSNLLVQASRTGFDLILFKRSLYMPTEQALGILQSAMDVLNPGGKLVIIHAERSLRKYAFGDHGKMASYTPYHLINRFFSRAAHILRLGEYTIYTQTELRELAQRAVSGKMVELIPSAQHSYNLIAMTKEHSKVC